jgi:HSP20 family protein
MKVKDLIPWNPSKRDVEQRREGGSHPVRALQSDVNRVFDEFWRTFNLPMGRLWEESASAVAEPNIDVRETDKEVEVTAELPGMEEDDIEVSVTDGMLMIAGEKESEREAQEQGYVLRERSVGRFERVVPLPDGLDFDSVKATFKNGLLKITIPKTKEAQAAVKRVAVKSS